MSEGPKKPLYLMIRDELLKRIESGQYPPNSTLKTEMELCAEFGVSRVTVRKALGELVEEGWLDRKSGRGTFIRKRGEAAAARRETLALVTTRVSGEFLGSIIAGFESEARRSGMAMVLATSDEDADQEIDALNLMLDAGSRGVAIVPCETSRLSECTDLFGGSRVPVCLVDREPALPYGYDYIGSDNHGGAYAAVRHLQQRGFVNTAFLAYQSDISTVRERLDGYLDGVRDFRMQGIIHSHGQADAGKEYYHAAERFFMEDLRQHLDDLRSHVPFGILAVNDYIAIEAVEILKEAGFAIGRDAAVIGFDNIPESAMVDPPLTTVVQNGRLIGQSAARTLISRLRGEEGGGRLRMHTPTQIMLRRSCGE